MHLHFAGPIRATLHSMHRNSNDGTGEPRTSIKLMCAHASTCCRMLIHICKERMHTFVCVSARNPVLIIWSYIRYCFTYIHMYTYACVCARVCVCVIYVVCRMCIYICVCVFIYLFIYVFIYLFVYLFIYVCVWERIYAFRIIQVSLSRSMHGRNISM